MKNKVNERNTSFSACTISLSVFAIRHRDSPGTSGVSTNHNPGFETFKNFVGKWKIFPNVLLVIVSLITRSLTWSFGCSTNPFVTKKDDCLEPIIPYFGQVSVTVFSFWTCCPSFVLKLHKMKLCPQTRFVLFEVWTCTAKFVDITRVYRPFWVIRWCPCQLTRANSWCCWDRSASLVWHTQLCRIEQNIWHPHVHVESRRPWVTQN